MQQLKTLGSYSRRYLVDFLFWVSEECWEVAEGVTVEHYLRLLVCAGHYVPNGPEGSSLDEVDMTEPSLDHKFNEFREHRY